MTEAQCQTCKAPSSQCQSPQFAHLLNASCLNHIPVIAGEVPWRQRERAPFEQITIENHDTDQMETLYHMDGCGCPACLRMVRRGYVKDKYTWRVTYTAPKARSLIATNQGNIVLRNVRNASQK